jgi:hypothetical protein
MSAKEISLEPMTTGMILDRTFRIYKQNFAVMIALSAIVNVPLLALTIGAPLLQRVDVVFACLAVLIGGLTFLIGMLIVGPLVTGAATKAVGEIFLGNEITAVTALKFAWKYVVTLLLIQIVVGLIVFVGLILLVVPGIMWMLSYSLVAPITVLEKSTNQSAIRQRSWNLIAGNRWKAFGILVVILIAQFLPSSASLVIQMSYGPESITGVVLGNIVSGIAGLLTYPLGPIAFTLLYYDLRIRKEGFDLEMLSRAIANTETA